jgi:hypothetical protein
MKGLSNIMKNHKKQDSISVNNITLHNEIKPDSDKPKGNADSDPFCVYEHKRHAAGSKIMNSDGSETVCDKDGTWKNSK